MTRFLDVSKLKEITGILALFLFFGPTSGLAKERSWLGPKSFVLNTPVARAGARLSSVKGTFFMFGGFESGGSRNNHILREGRDERALLTTN